MGYRTTTALPQPLCTRAADFRPELNRRYIVKNLLCGPVTVLCRPKCSFKPLSFGKRRGFSSPVLSGGDADCRSH